ncbi:N-acyl amino acid synthase, PEP-CTERM/exosortase system-associated [Nitrosomonas aestuarii]|uniref:N-acyl amino acid synthase, PEP-CTERM/exosortase system-associated n=1 Tax=Nitrosomonas aestuarii TaxID=52441 RepID=A0A1I3YZ21_9PROT|nr:PEP-CTERM/exosortase system-associated acyltransferase [Nitrosomonas aestuarii]SFK37134.1 N-acyl amino acid synthase, PEP-CTERM/exosortase system-associated [Nitrosomonas aestuarii]
MNPLYDAYKNFFEIVMADTPELKNEVYSIRYQVLCTEERIPGFDQSLYPDKLEKDTYDSHSTHALLKHRSTGKFIGTVRLVLPDPENSDKPFPVEAYTQLDAEFFSKNNISRQNTVEISRFLVIKEFQRRKGDCYFQQAKQNEANTHDSNLDGTAIKKERRTSINITLILMAAVVQMSAQHDVKNWLSFMNPSLNRLLCFSGLGFIPIGPLVECHGLRQPYFVKNIDVLDRIYSDNHDVWEILTDQGRYIPSHINSYEKKPLSRASASKNK